ncbi:MAG: hypothetical protein JOY58_08765, partial [Solirubrobacterales bacterium]|nr:hypothetical protein [Solirubrobacterales bacterium]
ASHERADRERAKRGELERGSLSYDLDGLRERVQRSSQMVTSGPGDRSSGHGTS